MCALIAEVSEILTERHGEDYAKRKRLNNELQKVPKGSKARHLIGKQLANVRQTLNNVPIRANKYQIVIKGHKAFNRFYSWACAKGWKPGERPETLYMQEFKRRKYWRQKTRELRARKGWNDWQWIGSVKSYLLEAQQQLDVPSVPWSEYEALGIQY